MPALGWPNCQWTAMGPKKYAKYVTLLVQLSYKYHFILTYFVIQSTLNSANHQVDSH
jgi:hypothetical protein